MSQESQLAFPGEASQGKKALGGSEGQVFRVGPGLRAGASILSSSHLPLLSGRVWPSVRRPWCWADLCECEGHASGQMTSLSVPAWPFVQGGKQQISFIGGLEDK